MSSQKLTYTKSGVNIKNADKFVKHISNISRKANKSGDFKNIGGFGAISNIPKRLILKKKCIDKNNFFF